ncbi:MAG TPA: ABC transporter ATP-binding protein [Acidimicrobiia bacterium]
MIQTTGLVKRYGSTEALKRVDLRVEHGSTYGLVGPNGAGKTTLLGILAGLRHPTAGSIAIDADRSRIAVLPDTPRFDPWLTGREVAELAQRLTTGANDRVGEVLADAGLADAMDRAVGGYSRGMLQRLGVACTIVGEPSLVLLDEPASALDPLGRREVLDLIGRLKGSATILFSSHILADVQEVCDTVGILDHGDLVFQGSVEALLVGQAVPRYRVRVRPPSDPVARALEQHDWVEGVDRSGADELRVTVSSLDDAESKLAGALAAAGARVISIGPEAVTLEQAFLEVTQ